MWVTTVQCLTGYLSIARYRPEGRWVRLSSFVPSFFQCRRSRLSLRDENRGCGAPESRQVRHRGQLGRRPAPRQEERGERVLLRQRSVTPLLPSIFPAFSYPADEF